MSNIKDYLVRGGAHSDIMRDALERSVMEQIGPVMNDPASVEMGERGVFNLYWFFKTYVANGAAKDWVQAVRPYPEAIEIEPTTACDHRCRLCENAHWDEKPRNMTFGEFKSIIDQLPTLKWLGVTGIGQSWLNPDYMKMLEYAKMRGVYIENFDNFHWIDSDRARRLVEIGHDKLYVSLDAATRETHDKVHIGSDWDAVIKNIKQLDKWKRVLKKRRPALWFHFIVMKDNIHEVVPYVDFVHSLGVECAGIQFSRMLHPFEEVKDQFVPISEELKEMALRRGDELGIPVNFNMNSNTEEGKACSKNCTLWSQPFVFSDGTIISCCSLNEANWRKWQKETSLGNVLTTPFREVWYGERYTKLVEGIKSGVPWGPCERCILFKWPKEEKK